MNLGIYTNVASDAETCLIDPKFWRKIQYFIMSVFCKNLYKPSFTSPSMKQNNRGCKKIRKRPQIYKLNNPFFTQICFSYSQLVSNT